ncbi:BTB domain and ankyrin repeat protein [Aspergillus foveolatus]|uniref:BTB domain and ankyrin repeat protein n=1 Tax=Aspergillus foveolatus TaxID=210207 RepID=UPI003CCDFD46
MVSKLWEFFLRDDVESFQRFLASASYTSGGQRAPAGGGTHLNAGSPGPMISSLGASTKGKKSTGTSPVTPVLERGGGPRSIKPITRDELNARDQHGRTLLHHVASSPKPTAADFALALLEVPYLDIYAQDLESGWTALHRALYAGNATIAQALMARDVRDATDPSKPGPSGHPSGGLIKIKDREGYSPFDVYASTITSRTLGPLVSDHGLDDASSVSSSDDEDVTEALEKPSMNLFGDEVFTFGSNKNLNLGVGDQDDRQYPERITLTRPTHLLHRFFREHQERHGDVRTASSRDPSDQDLPAFIKARPLKIQTLAMSKLHTAILTDDPESNLFMCGFGPGGRLGTGDESTRFSFVCIEGGGLANKKVVSVALGQDHTLAITEHGDILSWGSNKFGQLGYGLPRANNKDDVPVQLSPRQIFNPFKKEVILGAAASAVHSVVYSTSGLYTFGKNEGQLGLVDSDARSLEVQTTPRRVGASLFSTPIQSVSATDQATAILLQSHEVWVFAHYGYSRLSFPLEINSRFIRDSFMATRYDTSINRIVKIRSGGNTICALSSSGDVFTVQVNKLENLPSLTSTTNPAKIRNSLSPPVRVWSVKKAHMAVKDVDVGQDGSIIICTASGSAWRKERRRKSKNGSSGEYKFARVPGLSRVVGVCSNVFGAFAVVQRECDVTKEQINVDPTSLWGDIWPLSPFSSIRATIKQKDYFADEEVRDLESVTALRQVLINGPNPELYFRPTLAGLPAGTVWVVTTASDMRVPVHEFILTGRSSVLRRALHDYRHQHSASVPEILTIEKDNNGDCQILLQGMDVLSVLNLTFYLYTDALLDVWQHARSSPENASRYRQVRTEVMRIASHLDLPALERAAALMVRPAKSMKTDLSTAFNDPFFFESCDVVIELNGDCMVAHSQVICQRCPFFYALFVGRSGGIWVQSRRKSPRDKVHVDLKHIDRSIFEFVLRYMYADTDDRLFDDVRTKNTQDFVDIIIDVAFVADELMIDRLSQICQRALGKFVTSRNVCHLLNSVAPCFVTEFKHAALEYICLNLEDLISNRLLGDLDEHLLRALDHVCHDNQMTAFPISRGRNAMEYIYEKYPELVSLIEADKRRLIDSIRLKSRVSKIDCPEGKPRAPSEKFAPSPAASKLKTGVDKERPVYDSPLLKSKHSTGDLMFQMDDEPLSSLDLGKGKAVDRGVKPANENDTRPWNDTPVLGASLQDGASSVDRSYLDTRMASPQGTSLARSPGFQPTTPQGKQNRSGSPPYPSQVPWNSTTISGSKKTLKDIMSEASEARVSNLSLGMSSVRRENSGSFAPKLSQKERKKMQQQQIQEMAIAQQRAKEAAQSPWKIPSPAPAVPVGNPTDKITNGQDIPSPTPSRFAQRPGMTLRQTVAGAPSPKRESAAKPTSSSSKSHVASATTTRAPLAPRPSDAVAPSTPPTDQVTIKSVRHIPRPEPYQTSFYADTPGSMSLATILMQQQTEKDEIREAATAKHNLQDIQAEQAFQEWWDKESRRVQGIPEPGAEDEDSQKAERDGRGGRRGRGSKGPGGQSQRTRRGKGPQAQTQGQSQGASSPAQQSQASRNGSGAGAPDRGQRQQLSTPTPRKPHTQTHSAHSGNPSRRGRGGYRAK